MALNYLVTCQTCQVRQNFHGQLLAVCILHRCYWFVTVCLMRPRKRSRLNHRDISSLFFIEAGVHIKISEQLGADAISVECPPHCSPLRVLLVRSKCIFRALSRPSATRNIDLCFRHNVAPLSGYQDTKDSLNQVTLALSVLWAVVRGWGP